MSRVLTSLLRAAPSIGLLTLFAFTVTGCSCEEESDRETAAKQEGPPPPLEEKTVPSNVAAQIFPPVGATDERPVALVLAKDGKYCESVRRFFQQRCHVICSSAEPARAKQTLEGSLRFLKKSYPRHVASSPVLLVVDPARADAGWRLMLEEPSFFANAYLPGLEEKVLTSTTLSALHDRGARTLVVDLEQNSRLELLARVALRRGLDLRPVGRNKEALKKALGILSAAEPRLSPDAKDAAPRP
jgi:hypothetical protein